MIKITPKVSPKVVSDTINRIGVVSESNKTLFVSCVLIKDPNDQWWVSHFKELLHILDNTVDAVTEEDYNRLIQTVNLLEKYELVALQEKLQPTDLVPVTILKKTDLVENGGEKIFANLSF